MVWTPEITRARIVEAADILRRMPNGGSSKSGFWPAYHHSFEDMNGWGAQRLAEERESFWAQHGRTTTALEVSRKEEVDLWTSDLIEDDAERRVIVHWAECMALSKSFRSRCKEMGWATKTAYRRLYSGILCVTRKLNNSGALLRLPEHRWLSRERIYRGSVETMGIGDADPVLRSPKSLISIDGRATDTLGDSSAVDRFEKYLKKRNTKLRRKRERRLAALARMLDPSLRRAG